MASGQNRCRYYGQGLCFRENNCPYLHVGVEEPPPLCKYFQDGRCRFGRWCRFRHIVPETDSTQLLATSLPARGSGLISMQTEIKPFTSKLKTLKKESSADSGVDVDVAVNRIISTSLPKDPEQWVKAKEFIPRKPVKYCDAAKIGLPDNAESTSIVIENSADSSSLCPFLAQGACPYGDECVYVHGNICDICGEAVLHPDNEEMNKSHREICIKDMERDMELSFAVQRSEEKVCGICMEHVLKKEKIRDRRFGILTNCTHCFCLECIRKWRQSKQFENRVIRACPECRTVSDFVTPSELWFDDKDEKQKMIDCYKGALSAKPCKYFDQGRGDCPFNENCFYLHENPDGSKASPRPRRRRRRQNGDESLDVIRELILWDFIEERESSLLFHLIDRLLIERDSDSDLSVSDLEVDFVW